MSLSLSTTTLTPEVRVFADRGKGDAPKSNGYMASLKVDVDGVRYQVSASAWLIGSKVSNDNPTGSPEEAAEVLARVSASLKPKVFSSGKPGFYTQAKDVIGADRFQIAVQAVRIG
jgi:hypothetical protein